MHQAGASYKGPSSSIHLLGPWAVNGLKYFKINIDFHNDDHGSFRKDATKGISNRIHVKSWRSVFLPLECFPTKLIPVKLVLAQKEVSELEMVLVYWCQKNVNQEIFLLTTQKDKESREQREGTSPLRQLATILSPRTR